MGGSQAPGAWVDFSCGMWFSLSDLRDPQTEGKVRRHAELQAREASGRFNLGEAAELSRWLSEHLSPPGDTANDASDGGETPWIAESTGRGVTSCRVEIGE